ncbi:MAG: protein-glutamate O-methyltransferase CheR [bacterium]|nr:protein-glutamate O-methyltransferase CheR [bacterium]MDD5756439.1 protein-glutamate O-methyltransferase CheR [bacterium]
MTFEEPDFELLVRKILRERGFDCRQYRESYLKRRFGVRMRAWKVTTFTDYVNILDRHPEEYIKLFDDITINVTQFFRDTTVYDAFDKTVLPVILAEKNKTQSTILRIWSCGCSSGEEPYSIALCLVDRLGPKISNYNITIFASDFDDFSLNKGRAGIYGTASLENSPAEILTRYFIQDGNKFQIKDEIKSMVKFIKHDFIREEPFKNLDIIFCRNVMIYLTREMQTRLLINFYKSLNPKGFLVLGKVEGLMSTNEGLFERFNITERIFRKG